MKWNPWKQKHLWMPRSRRPSQKMSGSGTVDSVYPRQVWKDVGKLFQQETLSGVMLMAEGQSIPCHKFLLASASEYFYNRLVVMSNAVDHNLLEIEDISFQTLKTIVSYLYTGNINITVDNAKDVIPSCKMFKLHSACATCEAYLMEKISPANCISLHKVATESEIEQLKQKAQEVMMTNFREVVSSAEFQNMSLQEVEAYIQNEDLGILNEDPVYDAVISWIKYQPGERGSHFSHLVKSIRFQFCSNYCLRYIVPKEPLMQTLDFQKLLVSALNHQNPNSICWDNVRNECTLCSILPRRGYQSLPRMVVLGGLSDPDFTVKTGYWLLEDDGWKVVEECSMPKAVQWFSACMVTDNILVSGGFLGGKPASQCWLLSTAENQWSPLPDLNLPRARHASVCVRGHAYVFGGDKGKLTPLSSCECFKTTPKWEVIPDMPKALYHVMYTSYCEHIYIFGGKTTNDVSSQSCYVFRPNSGKWVTLPEMPKECNFGSAVVWKDSIYIVGGFQMACMSFDPVLNVWTNFSPCRHQHSYAPAFVWKARILVCGGISEEPKLDEGAAGHTSMVEEFDPETDTWAVSRIELPEKLSSHFVFGI